MRYSPARGTPVSPAQKPDVWFLILSATTAHQCRVEEVKPVSTGCEKVCLSVMLVYTADGRSRPCSPASGVKCQPSPCLRTLSLVTMERDTCTKPSCLSGNARCGIRDGVHCCGFQPHLFFYSRAPNSERQTGPPRHDDRPPPFSHCPEQAF